MTTHPGEKLTLAEKRNLKRKLALIHDTLIDLDAAEKRIRDERAELRKERDEITRLVYDA